MRDSFTFYRSFMEGLENMNAEDFKTMVLAISHYAMDDRMPVDLNFWQEPLFISWKANVDASNKRRNNGLLGGRPPKDQTEKPLVSDEKPLVTNTKPLVLDEKPNKNMKENKKEKKEDEREVETDREAESEEKKEDDNTLSFPKENDCRTASVQRVIDEWNKLSVLGVKQVSTIRTESSRYKMLCKRIADNGEQGVIDAINRIRGSDFLLGKKSEFLITFDWFVKPNNFAKVADGNYDNRNSGSTAQDARQAFFDKWRDV